MREFSGGGIERAHGDQKAVIGSGEPAPPERAKAYWRFGNLLFLFWTQTPQGSFDRVNTRAWVPMDDTHTMFVSLSWRGSPPSMRPLKNGQMVPGSRLDFEYLPNTTDWYSRRRLTTG